MTHTLPMASYVIYLIIVMKESCHKRFYSCWFLRFGQLLHNSGMLPGSADITGLFEEVTSEDVGSWQVRMTVDETTVVPNGL